MPHKSSSPVHAIHSALNWNVFENSIFVGINIQNILYGVELLLYFRTIHMLLINGGTRKKSNVFYACFSSMMLCLVTVSVANRAFLGEKMWLLDNHFPGGPKAYLTKHISDWYLDFGTTAVVMLQLMTDALMIYRCWIIYNNYQVIILPFILLLAAFALGFLVDWITSSPGGDFFSGAASRIGFAYYTTAVFLNTILTCMICYRIMRHRKAIREHLGNECASFYFTVVTLVVESVFPYTLSGIAFLVSLVIKSPTSVAFICVYVLMMCISPQLLILRVIAGRACAKDTFNPPSSMVKFSARETSNVPGFDGSGPGEHVQSKV